MTRRRDRSKIDPSPIVARHFATFVDREGHPNPRDYIEQFGIPVAAGVGCAIGGVSIGAGTGAAILTFAGLFAAFLFALTLQLLGTAASWTETHPTPGPEASKYATLLEEMSANAGYAALVGAATYAGALAVRITQHGWQERTFAAVTIGLLVHLATTMLLVVRRVFLLTVARLNAARSGTD